MQTLRPVLHPPWIFGTSKASLSEEQKVAANTATRRRTGMGCACMWRASALRHNARSLSVRTHRNNERWSGNVGVKTEARKKHSKQREASNNALQSREGSSAPRKSRQEDEVTYPHHRRESRGETIERIWEEVRKRTLLPTQKRRPSEK